MELVFTLEYARINHLFDGVGGLSPCAACIGRFQSFTGDETSEALARELFDGYRWPPVINVIPVMTTGRARQGACSRLSRRLALP